MYHLHYTLVQKFVAWRGNETRSMIDQTHIPCNFFFDDYYLLLFERDFFH